MQRVFRGIEEASGTFGPCALAIGNFDGVHIGHQELLRRTVGAAARGGIHPAVLTFHPHPTAVVAPDRVPEMLCTLEQRVELILRAGIDRVLILPFTPELSKVGPRQFVDGYLLDVLKTRHVLVGENFRFGHKHAGDADLLRQLSRELGFETTFVPPVSLRGELVSSSGIRRHIHRGNVVRAGRLLGRCFSIAGPVVRGQGIGSTQTVPTLNQLPVPGLVTPLGIYVTETVDAATGRPWRSVTSNGTRPTFNGVDVTIETYVLDSFTGATPEQIEVRFRHFLRPEEKYPDAATLKAQILRDVERAKVYWRRAEHFAGMGCGG